MAIIVSGAYALSAAGSNEGWRPLIGWHDLVTASTVSATSEDSDYPVTNLSTPRTNSLWKAATTTNPQYLTCLFSEAEVGYAGLARHNLGSGQISVTVHGLPAGGIASDDGDWIELVPEHLLANDRPIMWRFDDSYLIGLRLRLEPGSVPPQAAVFKVGKPIVLYGLPPGHVPITYGRQAEVARPRSQGGDHLGRTVLGGSLGTSIAQRTLDPDWYRAVLEPFRDASLTDTFFWAWAPQHYPTEVGYCEVTNDPQPVVNQATGEIDITFEISGIAL